MVSVYTHRNIAGLPPDVYFELKNASSVEIIEDRGLVFAQGYGAAQWLEVVHAPLVYPGRLLLAVTDTEVLLFPLEKDQRIAPTPLVRSAATAYAERHRSMLDQALRSSTTPTNPYLACLGLTAKKLPTSGGAALENNSSAVQKPATKVNQKGPVIQFQLSSIGYLGLQFSVPSSAPFWDLSNRMYDHEPPSWDRSAVSPGGGLGTSHADFLVEVQALHSVPEIFGDARSNVTASSCPPSTQLRLVATEPRSALPGVLHRLWARAVVMDAAGLPTAQLDPHHASAPTAAASFLGAALEALRQRDAEWSALDDQCECLKEVECELTTDGGLKAAFWSDDLGLLRWCVDTLDRAEGLLDAAPTHAHRLRCFELFLRSLRVMAAALAHADTCLVPGIREGWSTVFQGALKPAPLTLETIVEVCSQDLAGSFDAVQYLASLRENPEDEQPVKALSTTATPRRYSVSGSEELRFGQRTIVNNDGDDDDDISLSVGSLAAVVDSSPSTPRAQAGNCDQGPVPSRSGVVGGRGRNRINASRLRRRSHQNVQHDGKASAHSHANFAASFAGGSGTKKHDQHDEIDWLEFGTPRSEHSSSSSSGGGMYHNAFFQSMSSGRANNSNKGGDFSLVALAESGGAAVRLEADARMAKHPDEKGLANDLVDAQAFLLSHLHALAVHHAATVPREGEPTAVLDALLQPGSVQRALTESFTARLADRVRCLGNDLCYMYPRQWINQWLAAGCPCDDREPNDQDRRISSTHGGGNDVRSSGNHINNSKSNGSNNDGSTSTSRAAVASVLSPSKQRKALQRCLALWITVGQTVEVRQRGLSKRRFWRHAVITSVATRAKPLNEIRGASPHSTSTQSSPASPSSATVVRRHDRDDKWGAGWGLRYTVKYLPEKNAAPQDHQQQRKLQHHQEQLQQRRDEEHYQQQQREEEKKREQEVRAPEREKDHQGRNEQELDTTTTAPSPGPFPEIDGNAAGASTTGVDKPIATLEASEGKKEAKEDVDGDKTKPEPTLAVDATVENIIDGNLVANDKGTSSDSDDDDGVSEMWRRSVEMLAEAEVESGVLPQRIRPCRGDFSPSRRRDYGSAPYDQSCETIDGTERSMEATEASNAAIDEDSDEKDDLQDRYAALTAQFPGKPWFWWRSRQQSMAESVERPSDSRGWQHWGMNRRHAVGVPCPEFKGVHNGSAREKASTSKRLNNRESTSPQGASMSTRYDAHYNDEDDNGGEGNSGSTPHGDNRGLAPSSRAARDGEGQAHSNMNADEASDDVGAAAHEYVEVDYLCSGSGCPEVALHVIAGLLLSLLRHAPRGDIPLAQALLKFGAEEVKSGLCNTSTDIALRRAPNRAALRLNYRTAADLKAVAEIVRAALVESGLS